jgi:hypothetical protein
MTLIDPNTLEVRLHRRSLFGHRRVETAGKEVGRCTISAPAFCGLVVLSSVLVAPVCAGFCLLLPDSLGLDGYSSFGTPTLLTYAGGAVPGLTKLISVPEAQLPST